MKVLFVSVGGLGHVHPMVPLALAMTERGHELRWATSPEAGRRLASLGIEAIPVGLPFEDIRTEYFRRYPEAGALPPASRGEHAFPRLFGEVAAEVMVDDVLGAARDWRPDLIVQDQATFAGPIAAAAIGVPTATHGFGAVTPRERVREASDRLVPLWRAHGLEPRPYGGTYDGLYLDIYPAGLNPSPIDHVPRRQLLRPVPFDDAAGDEKSVWHDRGGDRPLVYLTLGTIQRGVSVLRAACEAIAPLEVRLLVTVGPSGDPAYLGIQPPNVRVRRYVPQTRVFEDCTVVVSHAGSGTFLAAAGRGIPQLCMPQAADQFLNAAACRRAGVGLVLAPEEADVAAIRHATEDLLTDPGVRVSATMLAQQIQEMPGPSEVAVVLETFVRSRP